MSYLSEFKTHKKFNGFGLIGHSCLAETTGGMISQVFDSVIYEMELSKEDAFLFANSAYGRYLGDLLSKETSFSKIKRLIRTEVQQCLPRLYEEKRKWN